MFERKKMRWYVCGYEGCDGRVEKGAKGPEEEEEEETGYEVAAS